jgi:Cd2+/Zn2+-exporting ATPase
MNVCGLNALGDTVRAITKDALAALHRAGIKRIGMPTRDNPSAAASVAIAVGMDDVRAELLPEDKVAAIEALVAKHGQVGMVGDRVNDVLAMVRATLGSRRGRRDRYRSSNSRHRPHER